MFAAPPASSFLTSGRFPFVAAHCSGVHCLSSFEPESQTPRELARLRYDATVFLSLYFNPVKESKSSGTLPASEGPTQAGRECRRLV